MKGIADQHEAVRYECGHRCYDAGIGGAPDLCPRCGLPVKERGYDV